MPFFPFSKKIVHHDTDLVEDLQQLEERSPEVKAKAQEVNFDNNLIQEEIDQCDSASKIRLDEIELKKMRIYAYQKFRACR